MGVAGDVDADGDQDLFFTNVGDSFPGFVVNGDRRDDQKPMNGWLLLRNDGGFRFSDATREAGWQAWLAWGAPEDTNPTAGSISWCPRTTPGRGPLAQKFPAAARRRGRDDFYPSLGREPVVSNPRDADLDGDGSRLVLAQQRKPAAPT
jgi:hypothetical protein